MLSFNLTVTRRSALKSLGALGAAVTLSGCRSMGAQIGSSGSVTDADIFNFALNLESLEAEYYLRGTTGRGMDDADAGSDPGAVNGGRMVPWENDELRQFMVEVAGNEVAHVRYYRRVLGSQAVSRPTVDLAGGFAAVGKAAGLGDNFDPFASEMNFFLGGMLMEDAGITAYSGAAPLIVSKTFVQAAAAILAVEGYHMGMARSTLFRMGTAARDAVNAISEARDRLDGPTDLDQGLVVNSRANFVPSDVDGKAFTRTPSQVLRIFYVTDQTGAGGGGLFPNGMNGKLRTT